LHDDNLFFFKPVAVPKPSAWPANGWRSISSEAGDVSSCSEWCLLRSPHVHQAWRTSAPKETPSTYTATPIPLKGHLLVPL
jgi:hypothetical protein